MGQQAALSSEAHRLVLNLLAQIPTQNIWLRHCSTLHLQTVYSPYAAKARNQHLNINVSTKKKRIKSDKR